MEQVHPCEPGPDDHDVHVDLTATAGDTASVPCSSTTSSTGLEPFDCTRPLFVVLTFSSWCPARSDGRNPGGIIHDRRTWRRALGRQHPSSRPVDQRVGVTVPLAADLKGSSGSLSPSPGRAAQGRAMAARHDLLAQIGANRRRTIYLMAGFTIFVVGVAAVFDLAFAGGPIVLAVAIVIA